MESEGTTGESKGAGQLCLFEGVEASIGTFRVFTGNNNRPLRTLPSRQQRLGTTQVDEGACEVLQTLGGEVAYLVVGSFKHPLFRRSKIWRVSASEIVMAQPTPSKFWLLQFPTGVPFELDETLNRVCYYEIVCDPTESVDTTSTTQTPAFDEAPQMLSDDALNEKEETENKTTNCVTSNSAEVNSTAKTQILGSPCHTVKSPSQTKPLTRQQLQKQPTVLQELTSQTPPTQRISKVIEDLAPSPGPTLIDQLVPTPNAVRASYRTATVASQADSELMSSPRIEMNSWLSDEQPGSPERTLVTIDSADNSELLPLGPPLILENRGQEEEHEHEPSNISLDDMSSLDASLEDRFMAHFRKSQSPELENYDSRLGVAETLSGLMTPDASPSAESISQSTKASATLSDRSKPRLSHPIIPASFEARVRLVGPVLGSASSARRVLPAPVLLRRRDLNTSNITSVAGYVSWRLMRALLEP